MAKPLDSASSVLYTGQAYSIAQTDDFAAWLAKSVGGGVTELRLFFGPGYRVYFMRRGAVVILLLAGGDKDSQTRDLERAKELARSDRSGTEDETV